MRAAIEEYGGTVEKFIGDAVMAVFGVPTVHEDDPLRAVQAAMEMKRRLSVLNEELTRNYGVSLANRTGINTGEVVMGAGVGGQRLLIGDTVNTAARLEQAAPEMEIVIGESTYERVRSSVVVEELPPLSLKGKEQPVAAFRLVSVSVKTGELLERHHERPLIGRVNELQLLQSELNQAVSSGSARLVSVIGNAGMGKSRLIHEFSVSIENTAMVLHGRCLPYGRDITFWPLIEMFRRAARLGEDDPPDLTRAKINALAGDGEVAERIGSLLGVSERTFPLDELFWSVRKVFEKMSMERPLVAVIDDIHWADQTLLNLIEHLVTSTTGPVVVICLTRPDLFDSHPDWIGSEAGERISLEPLSEEEMGNVLHNVLGEGQAATDLRDHILEASAGNPLFAEQMLSMLLDTGKLHQHDGSWSLDADISDLSVPPNIQALISARIDLLRSSERGIIEPASVIGLILPRQAIESLIDPSLLAGLEELLAELTRKQFLMFDVMEVNNYRFQHINIKDTVYQAIVKRRRSELHARFADWSRKVSHARGRELEFQEIVGYHLEQACLLLAELGPLNDDGVQLGVRAGVELSAAGRRAFSRGDMPAASLLFSRTAQLMPRDHPKRLELLPDLGEALVEIGEFERAEEFLAEAVTLSEPGIAARAELTRLLLAGHIGDPERWAERAINGAIEIIPVLEKREDRGGLACSFRLLAWAHGTVGQYGEAAKAAKQAIDYAKLANDDRQLRRAASLYAVAALWGPAPVPEAIASCEEILQEASGDKRTEGLMKSLLARLNAMRGDFDKARTLAQEARSVLNELGRSVVAASTSLDSCGIELLAGNPAGAIADLTRDYNALEEMGEKYLRSTVAAELARALEEDGQEEESERYLKIAEELAADDDLASQALLYCVKARLLARCGDLENATALVAEAVRILRDTDSLIDLADALVAAASVHRLAGRSVEAKNAALEAVSLFERKGDMVSAEKAQMLVTSARGAPSLQLGQSETS